MCPIYAPWKIVLILGIIASGFGTAYVFRNRQEVPHSIFTPALESENAWYSKGPGYDPNLLLPPPSMVGESLDPPLDLIAGHFREKAGFADLKPRDPLENEGPMLPSVEPPILPVDVQLPNNTTERKFELPPERPLYPPEPGHLPPPVVRLPAPPDEPTVEPAHYPVPGSSNATPDRLVPNELPKRLPTIPAPSVTIYTLPPPPAAPSNRLPAMWMYSNARDIHLNFDVTKRGSSGIKAVELWGRRAQANEYECFDRMEGDKPPFATRLWSEGLYEFRVVFVGGTGVKSAIPARAESPDLYVCLDMTPPVVEMLPAQADPEQSGTIRLRWKAQDEHLDENPIRLEYSVDGTRWLPIAGQDAWLPNTGVWSWKVPEGLPTTLHLRVLARDKAGNVGDSRTPSAVPVDLTVPEGRISGFVESLPEPREMVKPPGLLNNFYPGVESEIERELLPMPKLVAESTNEIIGWNSVYGQRNSPIPPDFNIDWETVDPSWGFGKCSWCERLRRDAAMEGVPKLQFETPFPFDGEVHTPDQIEFERKFARLPASVETLLQFIGCKLAISDWLGYRFGQYSFESHYVDGPKFPFQMQSSNKRKAESLLSEWHESYLERLDMNLRIDSPTAMIPPPKAMPRSEEPISNNVISAPVLGQRANETVSSEERELLPMPKLQPEDGNESVERELLPMPNAISGSPISNGVGASGPSHCNALDSGSPWDIVSGAEIDWLSDADTRIDRFVKKHRSEIVKPYFAQPKSVAAIWEWTGSEPIVRTFSCWGEITVPVSYRSFSLLMPFPSPVSDTRKADSLLSESAPILSRAGLQQWHRVPRLVRILR